MVGHTFWHCFKQKGSVEVSILIQSLSPVLLYFTRLALDTPPLNPMLWDMFLCFPDRTSCVAYSLNNLDPVLDVY